jgi:geranylgeranyl diphosphate synthase type II
MGALRQRSYYLRAIEDGLAVEIEGIPEESLKETMAYALFPGGKRLRPLMVLVYTDLGWALERGLGFALAIELVHAYTLIHDDLPALDNAGTRRGKPALHKKFSESSAILAGDGLLPLAFRTLCEHYRDEPGVLSALSLLLADTLGPTGLVLGQYLDLNAPKPWKMGTRERIATLKTGLLFRACLEGAGVVLGYPPETRTLLARTGESFGLAFQLVDDLKDEEDLELEDKKAIVRRVVALEGELRKLLGKVPNGNELGAVLFQALE